MMETKYDPTNIADRMAVLLHTNIGPAPVVAEVASIESLVRFAWGDHSNVQNENGVWCYYEDAQQAVADALAGQGVNSVALNIEAQLRATLQRAEKAEAERDENLQIVGALNKKAMDDLREELAQWKAQSMRWQKAAVGQAALAQVAGGQVAVKYTELLADIASMTAMLNSGEWAEHGAETPAGKRLESAITKLVGLAGATPQPAPVESRALDKFNAYGEGDNDLENETPIERLRFFCSIAMSGRDWIDVEQFFDALQSAPVAEQEITVAQLKQEPGKWKVQDEAPVVGPVDAETPLLKLCGQLDSMKRRLRHIPGTGQNESYLLADDVDCYVKEARAALSTLPAISTSKGVAPGDSALRKAASDVVARWDTPKWKDEPHTGEFIARLREALE